MLARFTGDTCVCRDANAAVPLVVDVDGTLASTDLLWEGVVRLGLERPRLLLRAIPRIVNGRAQLKAYIAEKASLSIESIPLNTVVLELIEDARNEGRTVALASAADRRQLELLAERVGAREIIASDGRVNLKGRRKLEAVQSRFDVFDYVGNAADDLPLLREARRAYLVDPGPLLRRRAARHAGDVRFLGMSDPSLLPAWVEALRPWQWTKNGLLLLPMFAAHLAWSPTLFLKTVAAIAAFSCMASALYLVNDLADLSHDRVHPEKRHRPLPAGKLSIPLAAVLIGTCLILALGIGWILPGEFLMVLVAYGLINASYSFDLKRRLIVDVVVLASLYTLRVIAGATVAEIALTEWFLAFSVFFFLSLALLKRVVELSEADGDIFGRAYKQEDLAVLTSIGPASAVMSALVYCLYITGPTVRQLYSRPEILWVGLPLFLYWSIRIWVLGIRGGVDGDPVVFVLRDRISWYVLVAFFGSVYFAA